MALILFHTSHLFQRTHATDSSDGGKTLKELEGLAPPELQTAWEATPMSQSTMNSRRSSAPSRDATTTMHSLLVPGTRASPTLQTQAQPPHPQHHQRPRHTSRVTRSHQTIPRRTAAPPLQSMLVAPVQAVVHQPRSVRDSGEASPAMVMPLAFTLFSDKRPKPPLA